MSKLKINDQFSRLRPIEPSKTVLLTVDVRNGTYNDDEKAFRPYFLNRPSM